MKKCLVSCIVSGFSLVTLPFLGGCSQQNAGGTNLLLGSVHAQAANPGETNAVAPAGTTTPAEPVSAFDAPATNAPAAADASVAASAAVEPAPPTEQKPPPHLTLSPVLAEVVKLAQAGVEEAVLLSYITNTTGYFALGADEIVYLNDLGVAGHVVTTMMEHDQQLRELRSSAWQNAQPSTPPVTEPVAEQAEATASAPTYVEAPALEAEPVYVSNNYFYSTLAPYGGWVYVPGYGHCWRPTVALRNPHWRPYGDRGRWVHTDGGWYWLSDYTWGATTFHYGRWFNDSRWGWCWWPDTVWAPSWVSWRYTSDYCGWAPLPPTARYYTGIGLTSVNGSFSVSFGWGLSAAAYAFVPWGSFCSPQPYRHCLPASRAMHVYNQSTAVNRYEHGGHGRAYNRGFSPDHVRERSRQEVRTVSLRDGILPPGRGERLDRDGRTLAVYRPNLAPADRAGRTEPQPTGRSTGRNPDAGRSSIPEGTDSIITPTPPATVAPVVVNRSERRPDRDRMDSEPRRVTPPMPLAPANTPVTQTQPEIKLEAETPAAPGRVETRPGRERESQVGTVTAQPRPTATVVARPPARTPEVVTAPQMPPTATPPAISPRMPENRPASARPQTTPRPAAPSSSIVVIGSRENTRTTGRDYSVWSTPAPAPAPSTPTPAPRENFTRATPSPNLSTPQRRVDSPAPAGRYEPSLNRVGRSEISRSENRTFTTPAAPRPSQSITPGTRFTPAPSAAPQPAPAPAPSFMPRPTAPTSSPRIEARPAPTPTPTPTAPATSRAGSSQNRPAR